VNTYADLNYREILLFIPLIFLTFFFGIYPEIILDYLHVTVKNLLVVPSNLN
jgi:NADH-quinone oxidoreductase subunit M